MEDRNFEIRKDVLKYDEVMNEQRKVIYRRRQQILDGGDLRDEAYEAFNEAINRTVLANCVDEFPEDWDLDELHLQMTTIYPTRITREQLDAARTATCSWSCSPTTRSSSTRTRKRRSAPTTCARSSAA